MPFQVERKFKEIQIRFSNIRLPAQIMEVVLECHEFGVIITTRKRNDRDSIKKLMAKAETRVVDQDRSGKRCPDSSQIFDELAILRPHAATFVPPFLEVFCLRINLFQYQVCVLLLTRGENMEVEHLVDAL